MLLYNVLVSAAEKSESVLCMCIYIYIYLYIYIPSLYVYVCIYIYTLLFVFPSHSGHHRALRIVPCAIRWEFLDKSSKVDPVFDWKVTWIIFILLRKNNSIGLWVFLSLEMQDTMVLLKRKLWISLKTSFGETYSFEHSNRKEQCIAAGSLETDFHKLRFMIQ